MFTAQKDNKEGTRTVVGLREDMQEVAHKAGHKVREFVDTAAHEARDVAAATEKQIRSNPVAASAIAAGIGLLLGALFRRRH